MMKQRQILLLLATIGLLYLGAGCSKGAKKQHILVTTSESETLLHDTIFHSFTNGVLTISGRGDMKDYCVDRWITYRVPWYSYRDQIKAIVIEEGVTSIGEFAFHFCYQLTSVSIPHTVTRIESCAFYYCTNLATIIIPESVTRIEDAAFAGSGLTTITVPAGVRGIRRVTFASCTNLTSATILNGDTYIEKAAFADCSKLVQFNAPAGIRRMEDNVFEDCSSLASFTIPNTITNIGYILDGCSGLETINVAPSHPAFSSVDGVLYNKAQKVLLKYPEGKKGSYTLPDSVAISAWSFAHARGLTGITVAPTHPQYSSVNGVLYNKKRTALFKYPGGKKGRFIIPDSVNTINSYAFFDCVALTSITIPPSVTSIESYAFNACSHLTSVTNLNPLPQSIGSNVFKDIPLEDITLYVPASSVNAYKEANCWNKFGSIKGI